MSDILNNVKNKANNLVDKTKLEKKMDGSESVDLKPNGIGRKYRCSMPTNKICF